MPDVSAATSESGDADVFAFAASGAVAAAPHGSTLCPPRQNSSRYPALSRSSQGDMGRPSGPARLVKSGVPFSVAGLASPITVRDGSARPKSMQYSVLGEVGGRGARGEGREADEEAELEEEDEGAAADFFPRLILPPPLLVAPAPTMKFSLFTSTYR